MPGNKNSGRKKKIVEPDKDNTANPIETVVKRRSVGRPKNASKPVDTSAISDNLLIAPAQKKI